MAHGAVKRRGCRQHATDLIQPRLGHSADLLGCRTLDEGVRRQGFGVQWRPKLRESLAHLVGLIMRRDVCDASIAFRASLVCSFRVVSEWLCPALSRRRPV